jgi:hypothetical protein
VRPKLWIPAEYAYLPMSGTEALRHDTEALRRDWRAVLVYQQPEEEKAMPKAKQKKIGRREFYLAVARSVKCDMNPLGSILREMLFQLGGAVDHNIVAFVRGKLGGRRHLYVTVARNLGMDLNPLQSICRAGLKVLAGYDDATIIRLVGGK